jgi:hypothetical protein
VRLLSDFFEMVDLFILVVTVLSIFYFLFRTAYKQLFPKEAGNETLGHDESNGLVHVWKKMPLPMKILFVIVDVGFLLAALYYFGFV